jgi:hypothetical protein
VFAHGIGIEHDGKRFIHLWLQAKIATGSRTTGGARQTLRERGFVRDLSSEQARNVSKIASLSAAATFSVPGAGKTTEALGRVDGFSSV